jgi:hypothetical protein
MRCCAAQVKCEANYRVVCSHDRRAPLFLVLALRSVVPQPNTPPKGGTCVAVLANLPTEPTIDKPFRFSLNLRSI